MMTSLPMLAARGGGGGGGRGTFGEMIIDPRSVRAAIDKEDVRGIMRCGAGGNRKWNGLNFKRLGKIRVLSSPGKKSDASSNMS